MRRSQVVVRTICSYIDAENRYRRRKSSAGRLKSEIGGKNTAAARPMALLRKNNPFRRGQKPFLSQKTGFMMATGGR